MTAHARPANMLQLDYAHEAQRMGPPPAPIIDVHTHIHGAQATRLYAQARGLFGVTRTYTMTQLPMAQDVRDVLGDSVRFITMPWFRSPDPLRAHREGYLEVIGEFHQRFGARMCKLWAAPALRDMQAGAGGDASDIADIDSPWRREHARLATSLGMMMMVHVADPDTWFATKYKDGARYGTKAHQYVGLRRMLDLFPVPWIAAHMGGSGEDLNFLDELLSSHTNLYIDTSATKWVVRVLSMHQPERVRDFFIRWEGRVLFGTDLVTLDDQLSTSKSGISRMADLASSPAEALELYHSRHWALRTLFETAHDGPSPIADPDLHMTDPARFAPLACPRLRGVKLPRQTLEVLYRGAAEQLVERWWAEHP
jgi:hypothetical protein